MESIPTWLAVISAAGTLIGGGFGTWLIMIYKAKTQAKLDTSKQASEQELAKEKQREEIRISETEQAFKIYKDVVDNLRTDVTKFAQDMTKLEQDYLISREENATLRAENKAYIKENDSQAKEIFSLRSQLQEASKK